MHLGFLDIMRCLKFPGMRAHALPSKSSALTCLANDNRSYHISSEKIARELGFTPRFTIEDAICELTTAFQAGKVSNPLNNPLYFNIKRMQEINLA